MKGFAAAGMGIGLPSGTSCAIILSVIVLFTSRSEILPRTRSFLFIGIVPFTSISAILQNSASSLDLTYFRRTNDGSHSVSPVIVIHVHCALYASVGTCVSKYKVFPSILNGLSASS